MCWPAGMAQASMKRVRFRGAVLALRKLSLAFAGERSHLMGSRIQSRITVREGVSRGEGEGRLAEGRGREREGLTEWVGTAKGELQDVWAARLLAEAGEDVTGVHVRSGTYSVERGTASLIGRIADGMEAVEVGGDDICPYGLCLFERGIVGWGIPRHRHCMSARCRHIRCDGFRCVARLNDSFW